ncbi:MAG: LEA type 2 family protein [Desulfuromonadales bacterium]|nr:LEA type 2 family protein [Desulfuromonadales bacterium]
MRKTRGFIWLGLLFIGLAGCATLRADFEQPTVTVSSFRVLPASSVVPKFEIGLHVVNPNRIPLQLFGMSYAVELEGHRILTGVASELPMISAYGEGDVLLQASPDLLSTINLFADLMNQPREKFKYNFTARLDVGKFLPKIHIEKSGEITLSGRNR